MSCNQLVGGLHEEREADEEVRKVLSNIHKDFERMSDRRFKSLEPISYRKQIVAGANYFVKVSATAIIINNIRILSNSNQFILRKSNNTGAGNCRRWNPISPPPTHLQAIQGSARAERHQEGYRALAALGILLMGQPATPLVMILKAN